MSRSPLPVVAAQPTDAPRPRVVRAVRRGNVLHPTPLGGADDVLGLNLTRGCAHRCAFCSVRASPRYPGDEVIEVYASTGERLARELASLPVRPRAVFLSPASDPFPPLEPVQAEVGRVVGVLAEHGVEAWLMTRGRIGPAALDVLTAHRRHVRVTVGLTTLDEELARQLEPGAAPPRLRLEQVAELCRRGVAVRAALDPLLPGLTDTRASLAPVLAGLAEAGVRQVTTGYAFLRQGVRDNLAAALAGTGRAEAVLAAYAAGPILTAEGLAPARYLPLRRRQHGYATVMGLAAGYGIRVSVIGLTNPDFGPPRPRPEASGPGLLARYLQAIER